MIDAEMINKKADQLRSTIESIKNDGNQYAVEVLADCEFDLELCELALDGIKWREQAIWRGRPYVSNGEVKYTTEEEEKRIEEMLLEEE